MIESVRELGNPAVAADSWCRWLIAYSPNPQPLKEPDSIVIVQNWFTEVQQRVPTR